jgi:hypothetical protein
MSEPESELCLESLGEVEGDPGSFLPWGFWPVIVEGWMYAPGMMYLGRAGPSKMIEFAPLSLSLIGVEDGGEEGGEEGTKTAGRIGPSKMSTHSLTLSLLGEPGIGVGGVLNSEGGDGGGMFGVRGNICACLEMEDE